MNIEPIKVELKCLFCDAVLTGDTDKQLNSSELIMCVACGNGNDYDSVLEVAKQQGIDEMKERIRSGLAAELSKIFKS